MNKRDPAYENQQVKMVRDMANNRILTKALGPAERSALRTVLLRLDYAEGQLKEIKRRKNMLIDNYPDPAKGDIQMRLTRTVSPSNIYEDIWLRAQLFIFKVAEILRTYL